MQLRGGNGEKATPFISIYCSIGMKDYNKIVYYKVGLLFGRDYSLQKESSQFYAAYYNLGIHKIL